MSRSYLQASYVILSVGNIHSIEVIIKISEGSPRCDTVILGNTEKKGWLRKPDFDGDGMYDHNLNCSWTIVADSDKIVQLSIFDFEAEEDEECRFDTLKVLISFGFNSIQYCHNINKYCESMSRENSVHQVRRHRARRLIKANTVFRLVQQF